MALRRAVQQIGRPSSLSNLSSHSHASSSFLSLRHMSQLAKSPEKQQSFLVDTLAMVPSLSSFKSQVQSLQENHYASVETEFEKLQNDMKNALREVRYEVAQRETAENVIYCCTGTLFAISAVGLI